MEMFNWAKDESSGFVTKMDVGIIKEGKVIVRANVTDMEKSQGLMTSDKMKAWDTKHNCVDVVYFLDKQ
jgi:hypothetical protein